MWYTIQFKEQVMANKLFKKWRCIRNSMDIIGIFIWFWNTGDVPSNVYSGNPNPTQWLDAIAAGIYFEIICIQITYIHIIKYFILGWPFGSWCPSSHFNKQQIIFDLTFCGDWDGSGMIYDHIF